MTAHDKRRVAAVAANGAVLIELPLGLAIIYALAIIIWYELLRSAVLNQVTKRRSGKTQREALEQPRRDKAEQGQRGREAAQQADAKESEPDPAQTHYHPAREARAERDAALAAANKAAMQAIERIERRHREISWTIDHEEAERINAQLGRPIQGD